MIPYETDPTLHDHEPAPGHLEDGFSPRPRPQPAPADDQGRAGARQPATDAIAHPA